MQGSAHSYNDIHVHQLELRNGRNQFYEMLHFMERDLFKLQQFRHLAMINIYVSIDLVSVIFGLVCHYSVLLVVKVF